ncbi:MAG: thermonuclease family protein [Magnetococcales bacterium]|nr:thermonuclease family protein [Magnetococcales bacterium]
MGSYIITFIISVGIVFSQPAFADQFGLFSGTIKVLDGDSMKMGQRHVRLFGIDAWELYQTCPDRSGKTFDCGQQAKKALQKLISGQKVTCKSITQDKHRRWVARCSVSDQDIGGTLVSQGWATAYQYFSRRYLPMEKAARKQKVGGWAGLPDHPPINPRTWRKNNPRK